MGTVEAPRPLFHEERGKLQQVLSKGKVRGHFQILQIKKMEYWIFFVDRDWTLQWVSLRKNIRGAWTTRNHTDFLMDVLKKVPQSSSTPDVFYSKDKRQFWIGVRSFQGSIVIGHFAFGKNQKVDWHVLQGSFATSPYFIKTPAGLYVVAQDYLGAFWKLLLMKKDHHVVTREDRFWEPLKSLRPSQDTFFHLLYDYQSVHHDRPDIVQCSWMGDYHYWIYRDRNYFLYGRLMDQHLNPLSSWYPLHVQAWNHRNFLCLQEKKILLWYKNYLGRWSKKVMTIF
jgi:hypothetical protein